MSVKSFVNGEVEEWLKSVVRFAVGRIFGSVMEILGDFEPRIGGSLGNLQCVGATAVAACWGLFKSFDVESGEDGCFRNCC